MATDKLFTVAGISKREGEYKVRFANDVMRVKVLMKGGHEDVRLVELDQPSTKLEAVEVLRTMAEFSDVIAQATIADFIDSNTPRQPKARTAKPAKAPKAVKPESSPTATKTESAPAEKLSAKAAYDSVKDMEDAPY
jgi:hypothetical protein